LYQIFNKFNNKYFIILSFFLISRFFTLFILNIHPNENTFSSSWVIINPYFLNNYLYESIKYLNFQPPLWNLLIGIFFKIFKTEISVIFYMHLLNIIITLLLLLIFIKICEFYYIKKNQIIFLSLIITLNPAIYFYETWTGTYVHYVSFALSLIFYLSIKYFKNQKNTYEVYIYALLLSLIYIWSAFSPIILLFFFIIIFIFNKRNKINIKKNLYLFIIFLLFSILPSIKNYLLFKNFSNGSHGLGWHLAMTTSSINNDFTLHNECPPNSSNEDDNEEYYNKYNINKDNLSITNKSNKNFYNFNQLGRIIKSEKCQKKSFEYIKNNSHLWIKSRINELIISHGQLAIDISFIVSHPKNFKKYNDALLKIHKNPTTKHIKQFILIFYFLIIYFYFFYCILFRRRNNNYAYINILLLYFYIVSIGTIFSNYEGSRFIHAGFIIQIIFWINIIKDYNSLDRVKYL